MPVVELGDGSATHTELSDKLPKPHKTQRTRENRGFFIISYLHGSSYQRHSTLHLTMGLTNTILYIPTVGILEVSILSQKKPKEKRVSDILDSAISEFLENGYEKTSMEAIARRANLTKGGLYHHFSSKDEILLAANQVLFNPINDLMTECASFARATDGLRYFIDQYLRYHMERPKNVIFFFLSMTKVMASTELSSMYRGYTEQYTAFFEGLFARAVTEGDLRSHNTHAQSLAYESALDGVLWYLAVNENFTLEETIKGFEEVFIDSLRRTKFMEGY